MAEVRELKPVPPPEADPDVVARCEQLLEYAKRGELQFFVLAGVLDQPGDPGGALYIKAGSIRQLGTAVLALENAKLRIMGYRDESPMSRDI